MVNGIKFEALCLNGTSCTKKKKANVHIIGPFVLLDGEGPSQTKLAEK